MDSSPQDFFSKKSDLDVNTFNGDIQDDLFQHLLSQNTGNDENVLAMWDCANFDESLLDSSDAENEEETTALNKLHSSFDEAAGPSSLLWNCNEQSEQRNEPTCYPDPLSSVSWPLPKPEELQPEDPTLEGLSVLPGFETLKRPFLHLPESTKKDTTKTWEGEYEVEEFTKKSSLLTEEETAVATFSELTTIENIVNEMTSSSTVETCRLEDNQFARCSSIPAPIRRQFPTSTRLSRHASPYPPRETWHCNVSQEEPYNKSFYGRTTTFSGAAFHISRDSRQFYMSHNFNSAVSGRWNPTGLNHLTKTKLDLPREMTKMGNNTHDVMYPSVPFRPIRSKPPDCLQNHYLPVPSGTSFGFQTSGSIQTSTRHYPTSLTVTPSHCTNGVNSNNSRPFYTSHPLPALFESESTTMHDDTIVISSASEDEN